MSNNAPLVIQERLNPVSGRVRVQLPTSPSPEALGAILRAADGSGVEIRKSKIYEVAFSDSLSLEATVGLCAALESAGSYLLELDDVSLES